MSCSGCCVCWATPNIWHVSKQWLLPPLGARMVSPQVLKELNNVIFWGGGCISIIEFYRQLYIQHYLLANQLCWEYKQRRHTVIYILISKYSPFHDLVLIVSLWYRFGNLTSILLLLNLIVLFHQATVVLWKCTSACSSWPTGVDISCILMSDITLKSYLYLHI